MTGSRSRPLDRAAAGLDMWLPWLAAPVFLLLPLAGCGAAAALRCQALAGVRSEAAAVRALPVAPVATVAPVRQGSPAPRLPMAAAAPAN